MSENTSTFPRKYVQLHCITVQIGKLSLISPESNLIIACEHLIKYNLLTVAGDVRTTIKAGTTFNISWHLGYPHQGGFRLELLDADEKHLQDLTIPASNDSLYVTGDTT